MLGAPSLRWASLNRNDADETQESPAKQAKVAKERENRALACLTERWSKSEPGQPFPLRTLRLLRGTTAFSVCIVPVCAGEAGCHAGESPAGRIRLFTTESCVREEAVRPNPKARRGLNCPVVTTVNLIQ